MMKPSSEPRAIGAAAAFHSSRVASSPPIFVVMTSGSSVCSTLASTSPMPNRPMATRTKSKPSLSLKMP